MKRVSALVVLLAAACTQQNAAPDSGITSQYAPSELPGWAEFRSHFTEVDGRFQGEWDLSFASEDDMRSYFLHHYMGGEQEHSAKADGPIGSKDQKLAVIRKISDGFEPVYGRNGDALDIVYCVSDTVPNQAAVITDMATATLDWTRNTNVRFRYDATQNSNCTAANTAIDFAVRPTTSSGLAGCGLNKMIWFTDCAAPGELTVQYSVLTGFPGVTGAGLLRHELGHILGFRHEHPWAANNGGCSETPSPLDGGANITGRRLTAYDQSSVMHYPQCSGIPNVDWTISRLDQAGAIQIYGIPAAWYVTLGA